MSAIIRPAYAEGLLVSFFRERGLNAHGYDGKQAVPPSVVVRFESADFDPQVSVRNPEAATVSAGIATARVSATYYASASAVDLSVFTDGFEIAAAAQNEAGRDDGYLYVLQGVEDSWSAEKENPVRAMIFSYEVRLLQ